MFWGSSKNNCNRWITWAELKQKSVREARKKPGSVSTFKATLIMQTFSHIVAKKGNIYQLRDSSKPPACSITHQIPVSER